MFAVRNLRLCTKDCLCLYVCPTGAADTETGQVDREKCTGCGACVSACPSHALSLMPDTLPPPQPKAPEVREELAALARSKAGLERAAAGLKEMIGADRAGLQSDGWVAGYRTFQYKAQPEKVIPAKDAYTQRRFFVKQL